MAVGLGPIWRSGFKRSSGFCLGLATCKTDPVADPVHMSINRDHRLAEGKRQHDISAFPADAGKLHQP